jgi:hypothetical protein
LTEDELDNIVNAMSSLQKMLNQDT